MTPSLYGLVADGEASAQVYSCASDREQARIVPAMAKQAGCIGCGRADDLTVDNVVPKVFGSASRYGGYAPGCRPCNSQRGTKPPEYRQDRLIG